MMMLSIIGTWSCQGDPVFVAQLFDAEKSQRVKKETIISDSNIFIFISSYTDIFIFTIILAMITRRKMF